MGPSPNQPDAPFDMDTGDTATCPITVPSASATSEIVRSPALRKAVTMNCSVWLVCGALINAEIVTAVIAGASAALSFLILMFTETMLIHPLKCYRIGP